MSFHSRIDDIEGKIKSLSEDTKKLHKHLLNQDKKLDNFAELVSEIKKAVGEVTPHNIQCEKCSHAWITKSKLMSVSCPNCRASVKNPYAQKSRKYVKVDGLNYVKGHTPADLMD